MATLACHLEALHMVLHMIMQGEQCPGEIIQSGLSDVARQDHNADKATFGLAHLLFDMVRNRDRHLQQLFLSHTLGRLDQHALDSSRSLPSVSVIHSGCGNSATCVGRVPYGMASMLRVCKTEAALQELSWSC